MDDFASAAMVRLLLRAMAAHGLAAPLREPDGARTPLAHKQQVVARIVEAGGLALLLRLAQQVHRIEGEPLHRALIGAHDPLDFAARWQRLERYVHASHRVQICQPGPRVLRLEHAAADGDLRAKPLAAESVAVLGVWIGALLAIGTAGLRVQVAGDTVHPLPDRRSPHALLNTALSVAKWHLRWSQASARTAMPRAPARLGLDAPLPWGDPAAALARWLASDPARDARICQAAPALHLSVRTLQRRLAQQGLGFSELAGEVRVRLAAAWLLHTRHGLADIGYLCGYADQPHFTREFTRRAGLPPARYRLAARSR